MPPSRLRQLALIIARDLAAPDVIAVQEMTAPHDGRFGGRVPAAAGFRQFIQAIRAADGPEYDYREVPPLASRDGGMEGANIRVGFLFNPDRVTFVDRGEPSPETATGVRYTPQGPQLVHSPGRIAPLHPAFEGDQRQHWLPSRKALAGELCVAGQRVFVIACHLKSMRANTGHGEICARRQRHAQAEVIHRFAAGLLACDPHAAVVILGDMNDLPQSRTLTTLKGKHFHNVLDLIPDSQRFTHRQWGRVQALDHLLVSNALWPHAVAKIARLPGDDFAQRASDHDPLWARLQWRLDDTASPRSADG